jgi:hypothetical protein
LSKKFGLVNLLKGKSGLHFEITPVFLGKLIDVPKLFDFFWDPVTGFKPDAYPGPLPPDALLGALYFAILALGRDATPEMVEKYLGIGHGISVKSRDWEILKTMYTGALTLGGAPKKVYDFYLKEIIDMGLNRTQVADFVTEGDYSHLKSENKKLAQLANATANAVLALRAENKSPEAISECLELPISEVNGILAGKGGSA